MNSPAVITLAGLALIAWHQPVSAQVPGIPEPPLVIHGTAIDGATSQPVAITSVSWRVMGGSESATLDSTSTPPSRILTVQGKSFYLLEIPFDTRTVQNFGGLPLTLPRNGQSLELTASSPVYTLTPFINGRAAVIRSVDGVPSVSSTLSLTNTPETNGRVMRVDLTLPPPSPYDDWAKTVFPDPTAPEAASTADFDHDGQTNIAEFIAGTDPRDDQSLFQISSTAHTPGSTVITWTSIPGKSYRIERVFSLRGTAWEVLGPPFAATAATTSTTVADPPDESRVFYRVTISWEP